MVLPCYGVVDGDAGSLHIEEGGGGGGDSRYGGGRNVVLLLVVMVVGQLRRDRCEGCSSSRRRRARGVQVWQDVAAARRPGGGAGRGWGKGGGGKKAADAPPHTHTLKETHTSLIYNPQVVYGVYAMFTLFFYGVYKQQYTTLL